MKRSLLCLSMLLATSVFAKLPAPVLTDEAKAKAWREKMLARGCDVAIFPGDVSDPGTAESMVQAVEAAQGGGGVPQAGGMETRKFRGPHTGPAGRGRRRSRC